LCPNAHHFDQDLFTWTSGESEGECESESEEKNSGNPFALTPALTLSSPNIDNTSIRIKLQEPKSSTHRISYKDTASVSVRAKKKLTTPSIRATFSYKSHNT